MQKSMQNSMRLVTMMLVFVFFLSACETVKGVGRDIESVGEALDDAVDN